MRSVFLILLLLTLNLSGKAANPIDSLRQLLAQPDLPDTTLVGIYHQLGKKYLGINSDSSFHFFHKALPLYKEFGEMKRVAYVNSRIGQIKINQGNFKESISWTTQSLEIYIDSLDTVGIAMEQNAIGLAYDYLGMPDSAYYYYTLARQNSELVKDTITLSSILTNLGMYWYYSGEIDSAISVFEQALVLSKLAKHDKNTATTLNNLGGMNKLKGRLDVGLKYYQQSMALYDTLDDKRSEAAAIMNIGRIYQDLDFPELALEHYKESEKLRLEADDRPGLPIIYERIGSLLIDMERDSLALDYLNRGLTAAQGIGDSSSLVNAYLQFSQYYFDHNQIDTGRKYLERAQNSLGSSPSRSQQLTINWVQVQFIRYDDQLTQHESLIVTGFERSQELGIIKRVSQFAEILSQLYEEKGELGKSLEAYKVFKAMDDSLKAVAVSKKTSSQQARLAFQREALLEEEQEREERRIAAENLARQHNLEYSGIGVGVLSLFGLVFLLGRFTLPRWAVELLVFLPFVVLFEFLLVYTDPFVDQITGGAPIFKLLINAAMAGAIFPLHSFFEGLLKRRLFGSDPESQN